MTSALPTHNLESSGYGKLSSFLKEILKQSRRNTISRCINDDEEGTSPPDDHDPIEMFSVLYENTDSQVQERTNSLTYNVFKCTVLSSLASLKSELADVKSDLRRVEQRQVTNNQPQSTVQSCPCLLYLRLSHAHDSPLGKNGLQLLLGCSTLYSRTLYPFEV